MWADMAGSVSDELLLWGTVAPVDSHFVGLLGTTAKNAKFQHCSSYRYKKQQYYQRDKIYKTINLPDCVNADPCTEAGVGRWTV